MKVFLLSILLALPCFLQAMEYAEYPFPIEESTHLAPQDPEECWFVTPELNSSILERRPAQEQESKEKEFLRKTFMNVAHWHREAMRAHYAARTVYLSEIYLKH